MIDRLSTIGNEKVAIKLLNSLLDSLTPRVHRLMFRRLSGSTREEISKEFSITPERAAQIENKVIKELSQSCLDQKLNAARKALESLNNPPDDL